MKNLHIFPNSTFIEPYINLINNKFDPNDHLFIVYGSSIIKKEMDKQNVIEIKKNFKSIKSIFNQMNKVDKIIIHGLFSYIFVLILFIQPWLIKKCFWVIWGGDLYYYNSRSRDLKSNIYEAFRKRVIRNMGGIITHIKGDYDLAKKWYGTKGEYYYSFMYPSNLYKDYDISQVRKENGNKKYIQLGNSADPTNNHIEMLKKLEQYKYENIEIICPLSYGDTTYRDMVIKEGKRIFGDKFIPLIDFMPFEEYLELLVKVDIAIFNHERQQAMGNISTLLGLGKKVYIRDNITTWEFCLNHELKVFKSNENLEDIFDEIDESTKLENMENMKLKFSKEKLIKDLEKIFR